jgi:hypothetical protein
VEDRADHVIGDRTSDMQPGANPPGIDPQQRMNADIGHLERIID